ncbi:MAG: alanine--tRNA ligase [Candidatus Cloacimonadota bacterium]|nr:alanine--tRNA ligase [Candidatus Cloacimonadota bacterium]
MNSYEIRKQYIEFFKNKGHKIVSSAPVIPIDDPTLLFINAGMNQFKDIFLGKRKPEYTRVVNSQKCIRAGGKHNDLDEVGRDGYHHTFFEMLGNWSFGDYYKKEAIKWAWELLTDVWKLPKNKLYATVHTSDEEAFKLWENQTDIEKSHIEYHGDKDNFWEMGNTGPCGPCSEIHIDRGEEFCNLKDDLDHKCKVNGDCHRYIELWNLVFIQFSRDEKGTLNPLENKYVDTGAGFERIVQVLQKKDSNYHTDLFMPIIKQIEEISGVKYHSDERGTSHRVIADHIRALVFALADGGMPSNEGRGYVLRRILRRAARHGHLLGMKEAFLYKLVDIVLDLMGGHFTELKSKQAHVKLIIKAEEERFNETLDKGLKKFGEVIGNQYDIISNSLKNLNFNYLDNLQKQMTNFCKNINIERFLDEERKLRKDIGLNKIIEEQKKISEMISNCDLISEINKMHEILNNNDIVLEIEKMSDVIINDNIISEINKIKGVLDNFDTKKIRSLLNLDGRYAFQLYDTYGFPIDLTRIMAEEKGLTVDEEGFKVEMAKQKKRARDAAKFDLKTDEIDWTKIANDAPTQFEGYTKKSSACKILKYNLENDKVKIVLDKTPFYAESGGQIADSGKIFNDDCEILISDVQKDADQFIHLGKLQKGEISNKEFTAEIDIERRMDIARNHTVTHILHKALKSVLGEHIQQKGSYLHPDHLRFDFTNFKQVDKHELDIIERAVNEKIRECLPIKTEIMSIEDAKNKGAIALFGEKYGETVRVVSIGEYSKELCGGTHLKYTGEIGLFKITSESSIAAGIRRIEGITGVQAEKYVKILEDEIDEIGRQLHTPSSSVIEKINKMISENKKLHVQLKTIRVKSAGNTLDRLIKNAIDIDGTKAVIAKINIQNPGMLRQIGDQLRDKLKSGIGVLFAEIDGKVSILIVVTKDLTNNYHAGKIIGKVAELVGGKGGGRPDMAMAGGKNSDKILEAIKKVPEIIKNLKQD